MLPHTTDEAWRALEGEEACLAMETMPSPFSVEVHPEWPKVMALRNDVLSALEQAKERGVENAMDAGVILPDPDGWLAPFSRCALSAEGSIEIQDLREEPRCDRSRKRDGTVRERRCVRVRRTHNALGRSCVLDHFAPRSASEDTRGLLIVIFSRNLMNLPDNPFADLPKLSDSGP